MLLATSRIGHLVLQGVKALIRQRRLLRNKNAKGLCSQLPTSIVRRSQKY